MDRKTYKISSYRDNIVYYLKNNKLKRQDVDSMINGGYHNLTADETLDILISQIGDYRFQYLKNDAKEFYYENINARNFEFKDSNYIYFETIYNEIEIENPPSNTAKYFSYENINDFDLEKIEKFFENILKEKVKIKSDEWKNIKEYIYFEDNCMNIKDIEDEI